MKKSSIKISCYLNLLIFLFVLIATLCMFFNIRFMGPDKLVLTDNKIAMFRYFTVDSNILIGLAALILFGEERKYLKGVKRSISSKAYIFKFIATVGVTVTFLTVFLYLGPSSDGGLYSMLLNSNLFYHLIIPVLAIISFAFFEKSSKIKKSYVKYGMVPVLLYSMFYMTNVVTHIENSHVSTDYDWYWFVQNGLWKTFIVVPAMFLLTYIVSYILWDVNNNK